MKKVNKFNIGKKVILNVLNRSKWPVKSGVLAAYTATTSSDSTNASVRKMVRSLVAEGHPIASNDRGYFIIRNVHDLHEFLLRHNERIRAHAIRTDQIVKNYLRV